MWRATWNCIFHLVCLCVVHLPDLLIRFPRGAFEMCNQVLLLASAQKSIPLGEDAWDGLCCPANYPIQFLGQTSRHIDQANNFQSAFIDKHPNVILKAPVGDCQRLLLADDSHWKINQTISKASVLDSFLSEKILYCIQLKNYIETKTNKLAMWN